LWASNTSPYNVIVQAPCEAYRLTSDAAFHEFTRGDDLQRAILEWVDEVVRQLVQSVMYQ
jgi:hypothetical protein